MSIDFAALTANVDHWQRRILQDAIFHASRKQLRERADQLEAAVTPRPGDFLGTSPDAEAKRLERREHFKKLAWAYRHKAEHAALFVDMYAPEVEAIWRGEDR